ncbi:MAG: isopentenyl phosphate kinase [Candidatus Thalassarchaeaceae archaeon]|nr:isopentenyl phosphate kinase [Candidatus Thalassarchaeaceae archaeon]
MLSTIVIKMGGGLITDKSSHKSVKLDVIDSMAAMTAELIVHGHRVILVHGAGSFGHLTAKKWGLSGGLDSEIAEGQREAVEQVREDMVELNRHVTNSLNRIGVECISLPPSRWANGTGPSFKGNLEAFRKSPQEVVMVTFGDVVDTDDSSEFGILSGDDLMARLSIEIPNVTHSIFLLGDSPGMLDRPPSKAGANLLEVWSPSVETETYHNAIEDVTGGIELKSRRAAQIALHVPNVWFIDGREPDRVIELLVDDVLPIGTRILP